ncbi:Paternally expressed 10 [Rhizoctonia solani]|uniref:Paternally expressed 10 n=1 Tax=Rhizoctonia solani TaxID=456999 RepID=A0A8H7M2S3_9AGAM|nr:Paternally expressed 10 [Rhizoctonia solani]
MKWQPFPEHRLSPIPSRSRRVGPAISATANEPTSLEPKVYGEISLSRAISLLLGLQNQVLRLERELEEQKEATKEAQDWMGAVDQALTCIEAGGGTPHTPEDRKPPAIEATPRPLPKTNPLPAPSAPSSPGLTPQRLPRLCTTNTRPSSPAIPQPVAPVATYQALVKVDHPDAYTGKIGNKAANGSHGCWHGTEFLAAFSNPDATQAAKRQITQLTQTGTCAEYITKFRTIAMDLDWNNAALRGQFAHGLHWELQNAALVIDNALQEERASHPRGNKPGAPVTTPNRGTSTGQQATRPGRLSNNPNFVSEEEQNRCRLKAYASSAANQGTSLRNAALAGKPHLRRKASRKKPPRLAKSLDWNREKTKGTCCRAQGPQGLWLVRHLILPSPPYRGITPPSTHRPPFSRTVTMLDGSSPQAGKIWKKANLTFSLDGKSIAEEEEADQNPLEGVPSKYHQYAKVFGEEEFNKLPPHRHYDIGIELTEEGPLNSPLYSMTDAESTTLKDWLRDELKAGKIRPSKSSISSL